ncbi:MAG: hypothetical protein HY220_03765 [Candidatus Sungbacteria bacterium]|uniref:Uncharacterized protein n=1 Tax=Candidatus Sungiibacteriota bacterium TaxID=2750080 RepID=A0A9D6LQL6_9BACT|nr:hypothetical protein [Candidatus Sungbacteria bacterium]
MDFTFETIGETESFLDKIIDLSSCTWCDPWIIGLVCLKAIENKSLQNKKIILPDSPDVLAYLKRMHFDSLMTNLGYAEDMRPMSDLLMNELDNPNLHEILHCSFRDDFNARLQSRIRKMFTNFGMNADDEARATAMVGELGNNVFDHNEGLWPTEIRGAIITAQNYPTKKRIEISVADPGGGFLGSLRLSKPDLKDDIEAIELGLSGITGRMPEKRGNGLLVVQDWTLNKFHGSVRIHSGAGLVVVDKDGKRSRQAKRTLGTIASLVVEYN